MAHSARHDLSVGLQKRSGCEVLEELEYKAGE